ncbi:angiopoietin-related protein 6 isoform X1 [Rattus rattus]|uniref:angiopoietin-related protein 6 isoform X1 n=1 Tax=Rattus rattus TaxID=10117 RepID=UPI0013F30FEB|nr:angiopoietin-related protein 6 isoform X1 [Rattus rattus]
MGTAVLRKLQLLLLLGAWRALGDAARCRVTLVLSPQMATSAVCRSSEASQDSELATLRMRLGRHEALLRALQRRAAEGGALAGEVRALREHSLTLNTRLGQLRAQLQQEAGAEPDLGAEPAAALGLLAERALGAEAEVRLTTARLQQLEEQLREHAQLMNQHSSLLGRLQRACAGPERGQQQVLPLPLVPLVPLSLVGSASNTSRRLDQIPERQREQSLRQQGPPSSPLPTGHIAVPTRPVGPWRDCAEAQGAGHWQSGVYELRLGRRVVPVWCEQQQEGGGWTVIQRRQDGSVNFFTNWQHYKVGFGRPDGEYWLGLEPVHQVTSRGDHELLILLEDWGGRGARAHYDSFSLEPESDHYRLRLGQYHGDAGDSLSWHNDKPFSTVDRDRDSYSGNCALYHRGGWWYHACAHSNLNGVWYHGGHYRSRYQDGVYWAEFRGGAYSLKKAAMLTRLVRL